MKTKSELSCIAKRAVEKRLVNRLQKLSANLSSHLRELIDQYYEAKHDLDYNTDIETIVYHEIQSTTLDSFIRFGDRKLISAELKRFYIKASGIPLDVQALYASNDYRHEITEQDFVDFMVNHPGGQDTFRKVRIVEEIKSDIKSITGFNATHQFIEKLYYKVNTVLFTIPENSPF